MQSVWAKYVHAQLSLQPKSWTKHVSCNCCFAGDSNPNTSSSHRSVNRSSHNRRRRWFLYSDWNSIWHPCNHEITRLLWPSAIWSFILFVHFGHPKPAIYYVLIKPCGCPVWTWQVIRWMNMLSSTTNGEIPMEGAVYYWFVHCEIDQHLFCKFYWFTSYIVSTLAGSIQPRKRPTRLGHYVQLCSQTIWNSKLLLLEHKACHNYIYIYIYIGLS